MYKSYPQSLLQDILVKDSVRKKGETPSSLGGAT
jgi:hypothetical protein